MRVGLALSGADVAALAASTDGWAAGLRLATLFLRGGADASSLLGRHAAQMTSSVSSWPSASSTRHTGTGDRRLHVGNVDHREDLRRTGIGAVRAAARAGDARRGRPSRAVPASGRRPPRLVSYHQLFAQFLRRRLARDAPERSRRLHRTAAAWFAEHGYLNEAVNHALAVDDPKLAVDLVERDETRLLEESKMTTFLEIAKKLPPRLLAFRARLQLAIAWANILLQRRAPADAALNRFEAALAAQNSRMRREPIFEWKPTWCAG
jgi:serine/threonine-protein kinase PknK